MILNFKDGLEANLNNPKILFSFSPLLKKFGFIDAKNVYYKTLNLKILMQALMMLILKIIYLSTVKLLMKMIALIL